jgi:hypothetical protein
MHQRTAALFFFLLSMTAGIVMARPQTMQAQDPNPTPIVIDLTPTVTPTAQGTAVPGPTEPAGLPPDRFETNNRLEDAAMIGFGIEAGLNLPADDVDYFTGYVKAGQLIRASTTVYGGLDTFIRLYWNGSLAAENDDRQPADPGSTVTFAADGDGWFILQIGRATVYDGVYDLELSLVTPTPTATPSPTVTPPPTMTPPPSPTPRVAADLAESNDSAAAAFGIAPGVAGQFTIGEEGDVDFFRFLAKAGNHYACRTTTSAVDTVLTVLALDGTPIAHNDDWSSGRIDSYVQWRAGSQQEVVVRVGALGGSTGGYELLCQTFVPVAAAPPATTTSTPIPAVITGTQHSESNLLPLSIRPIATATATPSPPVPIRLMVYYDVNDNRQPDPGEGIPNVSVLAVDVQGRQMMRLFTSAQGEAVFNVSASSEIDRLVVPFVSSWSARVRAQTGVAEISLGLPAVRLPVFLPLASPKEEG